MKIAFLIQQRPADITRFHSCDFNRGLYQGDLPKSIFRIYLEQDLLYLADYRKALNMVSSRLHNQEHARVFEDFARDTIALEEEINAKYLRELAPDAFFSSPVRAVEKIPAIAEYTAQLLYNAEHGPIEEAVISLIPCAYIYMELGEKMVEPGELYREWITTYKDEKFRASTREMVAIADELNSAIECPARKERIASHFWQAADFEYRFFEEVLEPVSEKVSSDMPSYNPL